MILKMVGILTLIGYKDYDEYYWKFLARRVKRTQETQLFAYHYGITSMTSYHEY